MKKIIYIASALLLISSLNSCQKTEFQEVYSEIEDDKQDRITIEEVPSVGGIHSKGNIGDDAVIEVIADSDKKNISVKEVSDGDDESDDDDNTSE